MNFERDINLLLTLKEYLKDIEKEKEDRKNYTLIETGKGSVENFNINLLPNFNGFQYPYVNLEIKYTSLITDLDITNELIKVVTDIWRKVTSLKISPEILVYNTYLYNRLQKLNQYIIFDLKHFIDETIATIWIIYKNSQTDSVVVADIGDYLKDGNKDFKILDNFIDLFKKMNDLFNSYKHSYLNTDCYCIGKNEPCFIALGSKSRALSSTSTFYCISMNYIINEFNRFYKASFDLIDTLTKALKIENK